MSIVITGNPGVGKHTVTRELAEKLNLVTIDINKIANDANLFEKIENTNEIDTTKLAQIFEKIEYKNSIVVGHLAPYVLKKNDVEIMIILRRNPYDLRFVYEQRNYENKKINENIESEILGIIAHDAMNEFQEKVFQVNTSGKSVKETVEKILDIIENKKNNEIVDWLGLITKNNDLKRFFVD